MQLVLSHLLDLSELMQLTEQLDAVVRLDVVKPVAEHLQQRVQNAPCVALEHARQQLTCIVSKFLGLFSTKISYLSRIFQFWIWKLSSQLPYI